MNTCTCILIRRNFNKRSSGSQFQYSGRVETLPFVHFLSSPSAHTQFVKKNVKNSSCRNVMYPHFVKDDILSHNDSCFQCNIAITNFLVSNKCEIRFHDVIGQSTVHLYSKFLNLADLHGHMSMFWTLIFQFNSLDSVTS